MHNIKFSVSSERVSRYSLFISFDALVPSSCSLSHDPLYRSGIRRRFPFFFLSSSSSFSLHRQPTKVSRRPSACAAGRDLVLIPAKTWLPVTLGRGVFSEKVGCSKTPCRRSLWEEVKESTSNDRSKTGRGKKRKRNIYI